MDMQILPPALHNDRLSDRQKDDTGRVWVHETEV
jgi:hypothetical protein